MKNRPSIDQFRRLLKTLNLRALARSTGFSQRRARKASPVALAWAAILGVVHGATRGVSDIALATGRYAGRPVSRQAIHKRLASPGAVAFFEQVCARLIRQLTRCAPEPLPGRLGHFADVIAIDSTVVTLLHRLARLFPACRTNSRKAALKIHACMSLTGKEIARLQITHERVHDRRGTAFGQWVRGRLLLFDLGYFDYGLFNAIKRDGGAFLTRLKTSSNGRIVAVRTGCAQRHVGTPLNQAIYRGRVVDLDAWLGRGDHAVLARVVGIWNPGRADYHWYVTSLAPQDFTPDELAICYGLRWQIERLFHQWKHYCHLTDIRTTNPHLVYVLVYASLAFALLTALMLAMACRLHHMAWHAMSITRALKIVASYASEFGEAIVQRSRDRWRLTGLFERILEYLAIYAELPNKTNAVLAAGVLG